MNLSPGSKLGPYEILSSIGSGGMGEVWKARDTRLGRTVAIKKVKEQHSERFKQEARSIAALNHPNICQIFDIGDNYLVLEYVEGKSLSSPLPEQEAVRLGIQIATALEEAHQHGIVHRDLKPSNIMVTGKGTVKLLDFGLAKLYEQDASISSLPTADFPATQAGAILGTAAYMSPEQAQGQPADARSDIFSFGLVLYELLSGRRAFSGDSNYAVMDSIVRQEPHPLQASPSLEKIVKRCLEKNPSDRYQRMPELKVELVKETANSVTAGSDEPPPSIAVLPFADMSPGKDNEWFGDGVAEEIINALTQIPDLKVIARTSAFSFKGKDADIGRIRDRLKVQNILEGSVRKSGNRIRVTAQLINTADESHLWSERYDRDMADVFAIQDEISQAIAEKLRVQLSGDRTPVTRQTENMEAYSLYLKGRHQASKYTPEGLAKGKEYYERALAMDGDYVLAWYGLARFYYLSGLFGLMQPSEANAQSGKATQKIFDLDARLPEAHSMMAILYANDFDWKGSETGFQRALQLSPRSSEVWHAYSYHFLASKGLLEEAIEASGKALELDPLSPFLQYHLAERYFLARQYDRAITLLRGTLEIDPQYQWAHIMLGTIYFTLGMIGEGIALYQTAANSGGNTPTLLGFLGWGYARAGSFSDAQKLLEELEELGRNRYVPPSSFMSIYAGLGNMDKAIDWMERAIDMRDGIVLHVPVWPTFDSLRSHPRYRALLRKMNLEP